MAGYDETSTRPEDYVNLAPLYVCVFLIPTVAIVTMIYSIIVDNRPRPQEERPEPNVEIEMQQRSDGDWFPWREAIEEQEEYIGPGSQYAIDVMRAAEANASSTTQLRNRFPGARDSLPPFVTPVCESDTETPVDPRIAIWERELQMVEEGVAGPVSPLSVSVAINGE
jgi:hypothetical protein